MASNRILSRESGDARALRIRLYRDALTGVPLTPEAAAFIRFRDYDPSRHPLERKPIPSRLHNRDVETAPSLAKVLGNFNGGLVWSRALGEYLHAVAPEEVRQRRVSPEAWWESISLTNAVAAQMGLPITDALLAVRKQGRDWEEVAKALRHSLGWLYQQDQKALASARAYVASLRPAGKGGASRRAAS